MPIKEKAGSMLVGREYEHTLIQNKIQSDKAELGILYGRRRIGKSTLLKSLIKNPGDLYFEGIKGLSQQEQIRHFVRQLAEQTQSRPILAQNWSDAFDELTSKISSGRHFIVFDELPWMASEQTKLIAILKYYWDNKWKENPGNTLVLCGSIANFMIKHVVHSTALHNRKTFEIKLDPLKAKVAKEFFKNYRSDFEISKFLMIFGGVPKYLEQIEPKHSLAINLNRLCFQQNSFFLNEYETIFKEQFKVSKKYQKITRTLSLSGGQSKEQLSKSLKISSGGSLTLALENLERAEFIKKSTPITLSANHESKTTRYHLWDEWLKFHCTYIEPHQKIISVNTQQGLFEKITAKSLSTYFGLAFERLCSKNITSLLDALEIPLGTVIDFGPYFKQGSRKNPKEPGIQIDLLIVRQGQVMTLIECKFTEKPIDASIIPSIEKKVKFLPFSETHTIEKVLISAAGITPELRKSGYFHQILGLEAIFDF